MSEALALYILAIALHILAKPLLCHRRHLLVSRCASLFPALLLSPSARISLGALLNRRQHPHRPHRRQHPHRLHRRQHHIVLVILVVLIVVMSIIITTMIVVISILS